MIADTLEQAANIRRLHYAEHWKIGTIAEQLSLSWHTVHSAVITRRPMRQARPRPSVTDPFLPMIRQILERHPSLRATRIYEMLRDRGYSGGVVPVRRAVASVRPAFREAFLRLRTFPGEQAQVDWAHFGVQEVSGGQRRLSCFVLTLSYSRALYLEFFYDQSLESFQRGHVRAFEDLGGVPRSILYDNLKSAVLERHQDAIQLHPRLLELCAHYHFAPRPCGVRRGNEKGRVERAIQYIRASFFAARSFSSLEDLNLKARTWRDQIAHQRPCAGDDRRTVAEVLAEERSRLLPLPAHRFDTDLVLSVRSQKTPYVRFDLNDYSIPPAFVGRPLTLVASDTTVRLLSSAVELARHPRCWGRHELVEDPTHLSALRDLKRRAHGASLHPRLRPIASDADAFLAAALALGEPPAIVTRKLVALLDDYGQAALRAALRHALAQNTPRVSSVAYLLEKKRHADRRRPPLPITLSTRPDLADLSVTPADPEIYDGLSDPDDDVSR